MKAKSSPGLPRLYSLVLLLLGFAGGLFTATLLLHGSATDPIAAIPVVHLPAAPLRPEQARAQAQPLAEGRLAGIRPMAFVFVTGCTGEYQEFQANLMEWSWDETGTEGTITRIVGGCKTKEQELEAARSPLSGDPRHEVFFAHGEMRYVPVTGKLYPYRGKPWSLMQWMEADLPPWTREQPPEMVVILDPDFMVLRPLSAHPQVKNVRKGHMLASTFDMGGSFIRDFPKFLGEPIPDGIDDWKALKDYSSGPPWFVEYGDFMRIMPFYANYTDQLGTQRGEFLDEQYAFLHAAVHFKVPMLPDGNLISVSNPVAYREAWTGEEDWKKFQPYLMHYCITHGYQGWYFHKSLVTRDGWYSQKFDNLIPGILSCDAPALQEPPLPPTAKEEPDRNKRMTAWFLYRLIPRINAGARAFRAKICPAVEKEPGAVERYVRTISPLECNGRTTSLYYVPKGEGPQGTSWEGNGIGGRDVCLFQNPDK